MKNIISSMAAVLIVAFMLGAFIGMNSPTEVQAREAPPCFFSQCVEFTGPIGPEGCSAPCYRPYNLYGMENILGCCGPILQSGCWCVCC